MSEDTISPGQYRHFKGGLYQVLGLARHSETRDWHVVYQALYGEQGLWVRPLVMFTEEVEHEGRRQRRFTRLEEETGT